MMPIAVFYHCLFTHGKPREVRPGAMAIVLDFMMKAAQCGLLDACSEFVVGVNGTEEESGDYVKLAIPKKARVIYHGLDSFAENLTICALHTWAQAHPNWAVLYCHAKGCTHDPESPYAQHVSGPWRGTMTAHLVGGWKESVAQIEAGADIVCCHWLWGQCDGTQHIPAGNFLWLNSTFAGSLPPMHNRERIKSDGIAAASSRYEAEVFWGNGHRPTVFQWLPSGGGGVP